MLIPGYSRVMSDEFDAFVAQRLDELRAELTHAMHSSHLSNAEVARRCGLSRQQVNNLVKGNRRLTLEAAVRVGHVFGMTVEWDTAPKATAEATVNDGREEKLLLSFRELPAPARVMLLAQAEMLSKLPAEAIPVLAAEAGVVSRYGPSQDDDSDLP